MKKNEIYSSKKNTQKNIKSQSNLFSFKHKSIFESLNAMNKWNNNNIRNKTNLFSKNNNNNINEGKNTIGHNINI